MNDEEKKFLQAHFLRIYRRKMERLRKECKWGVRKWVRRRKKDCWTDEKVSGSVRFEGEE